MSEKQKAKQKEHYVDNKVFLQAMIEWRLKYDKAKEKMKPALSAEEMEKIYRLADQMDQMQQVDQRESAWTEQDLIDLFGKRTIH